MKVFEARKSIFWTKYLLNFQGRVLRTFCTFFSLELIIETNNKRKTFLGIYKKLRKSVGAEQVEMNQNPSIKSDQVNFDSFS